MNLYIKTNHDLIKNLVISELYYAIEQAERGQWFNVNQAISRIAENSSGVLNSLEKYRQ